MFLLSQEAGKVVIVAYACHPVSYRAKDCWAQGIRAQPEQLRESPTKKGDFLQTGQIYIQRSEIHKKNILMKTKKDWVGHNSNISQLSDQDII